jgi:4-hydroxy-tetrahydrodipicolinate synthase
MTALGSALGPVLAPVLTPFAATGEVDTGRFVDHARWLLAQGCSGLAPFGTTSEGNSLSGGERKTMLVALLEAGIDPAGLMPGTGLCSLPDTVDLTRHAVDHGCGGVLMLPPFYYKNVSDDGLYRYFASTIERVGSSKLRVYLYHIPPFTQIGVSIPLIERLRRDFPDIVVGLKDSSGDWSHTRRLIEALPGFRVYSGSDATLLDNLRLGGAGCISATANINARMLRQVADAYASPDAETLQAKASAIRKEVQLRPLIQATKAIIAHVRKDPGWMVTRAPLDPLPAADAAALIAKLTELGYPATV